MFPEIARDEVFRLETRRLWLRWPRVADMTALCALANDWEVARLTAALPHPYASADADQFIRDSREDNLRGCALRLALTLKSGGRDVVGVIGVEAHDDRPMLDYWLGRPFWSRGLMSEAVAAMVHAFSPTPTARSFTRGSPRKTQLREACLNSAASSRSNALRRDRGARRITRACVLP
jgi:RimJ/RimL family protein N-acetyltransferase